MVDALVSGASAARRAGSSPVLGTVKSRNSLKIKSCGISLLIFIPRLSPKSFLIQKLSPIFSVFLGRWSSITKVSVKYFNR